ncbi:MULTISPECIES: hypothetical protein [unclassified Methanosarcina]
MAAKVLEHLEKPELALRGS